MASSRSLRRAALWLLSFALVASSASAQTRVRVTRDQTPIYGPGFTTTLAVVKAGTELEVVARRDNFYEVYLPSTTTGETGLVAVSRVEPLTESPRPATPRQPGGPRPAARGPAPRRDAGVRGFAYAGYQWFTAQQSFEALFGDATAPWFGGGVEARSPEGAFIQFSAERFRKTGQRVFVSDGEVFRLGIPDTVTVTPLALTIGYRFNRRTTVPYIGGGAGVYYYREESAFSDPSENVKQHFTSYHVMGGVEWRGLRWLAFAVEGQFTRVPNKLSGGVADTFDEHNLGGTQARVKVVVGK